MNKQYCNNCTDLKGISIGMTCPTCNRPFRNVISLSLCEIRDRIDTPKYKVINLKDERKKQIIKFVLKNSKPF